jgi:hypothetical protein
MTASGSISDPVPISGLWEYGSGQPLPAPVSVGRGGSPRYLAFSLDIGAFNNIWMNFEVMALLAWLTDRTLVFPPPKRLHLLGDEPCSILDFVDRRALEQFVRVVTAKEFADETGLHVDPVDSETFHQSLVDLGQTQKWNSEKDALLFPGNSLTRRLELIPRLLRRRAVTLEESPEPNALLYFPSSERCRILGPFETFVLFEDVELERLSRRFVRDAVRYHPRILNLADQLLQGPPLDDGPYSALHIRRGDFQYQETRVEATSIIDHTAVLFHSGETVYVATDESDGAFLDPLRERYRVVTWRDLPPRVTQAVPPRWVGIVETLICAAAQGRFAGTRLSTFSARAATVRGHLSVTPGGPRYGVDAMLYYTQPPLQGDVGPNAAARAAAETAEPWWRSISHTPLWGRAYPPVWRDAG